jgi:hypothetical protein
MIDGQLAAPELKEIVNGRPDPLISRFRLR